MKTYTFELVLKEGNDEYWEKMNTYTQEEQLNSLKQIVVDALEDNGFFQEFDFDLKFVRASKI